MEAQATIHTAALSHNLSVVRSHAPECRVYAVVKANGYGHGLERVARALAATDGYAVARMGEAVRLREAGLAHPILLLEGAFSPEQLDAAVRHHLDLVVHSEEQVRLIERYGGGGRAKVWLKVDTGMHRLGLTPSQLPQMSQRLGQAAAVAGPVRLMTHLASADEPNNEQTAAQIAVFQRLTADQRSDVSVANSAGIMGWPPSTARVELAVFLEIL